MKERKKLLNRGFIAKILLLIYDAFIVNFSYFLALWFRYDCNISELINGSHHVTDAPIHFEAWIKFIPINTLACLLIFTLFKLYRSVWTFASYREFFNVAYASLISFVVHAVGITLIFNRMPITYYFFGALIQFIMVLLVRFS